MKRSPAFIDYSAAMETAYMTAKEIYEPEERSKKKIRLCHEAEYGDEKESNDIQENKLQTMKTLGAVCEGDLLLAQLYAQLRKNELVVFQKQLDSFQWKILHVLVESVLPQLYGDSWSSNKARVKKMMGITGDVYQCTSFLMPRRYGKTDLMLFFLLNFHIAIPKSTGRYHSTCGRISKLAQDTARNMYTKIDPYGAAYNGPGSNIVTRNTEKYQIISVTGEYSSLFFYPENPDVSDPFSFFFLFLLICALLA